MAIDYDALADEAKQLVEDAGREVTIVQYNDTPADSAQPWKGPADVRATPVASHNLFAVQLDIGTLRRLGMATFSDDLIKRSSKFYMLAPGADFTGDLSEAHEVNDESTTWRILGVDTFKPAGVVLVVYLAVAR
jgi:hypothetical protein